MRTAGDLKVMRVLEEDWRKVMIFLVFLFFDIVAICSNRFSKRLSGVAKLVEECGVMRIAVGGIDEGTCVLLWVNDVSEWGL